MRTQHIYIGGQMFVLASSQDADALKTRILAAVESGGAFVEFEAVGRGHIDVLVTSSVAVHFESAYRNVEPCKSHEVWVPVISEGESVDIDDFLDHFNP